MLTYTDADLESMLDPDAVIASIRDAFGGAYKSALMPQRTQLVLKSATVLFMPCAIAGEELCGTKIVTVSRAPRLEGRVTASYVLVNTRTGQIIAVLAANYLTGLRTAATSVIATEILARRDATALGIFGTGRQAEAHIRIFSRGQRFQRILVSGRTPEQTSAFAARMQVNSAVEIIAADVKTCASTADVICTCTSATEPLFPGDLVRRGTHLNLIGTFQPQACEVDSTLISRARVFVDTYEGCLTEAGDILLPLEAGEISRDHIKADLHELITMNTGNLDPAADLPQQPQHQSLPGTGSHGRVLDGNQKLGRTSPDDITVFKSVGCALEDLVTAKLVRRGGTSEGVGPG